MGSTSDLYIEQQIEKRREGLIDDASDIAAKNIAAGESRKSAIVNAVKYLYELDEASWDETGTEELLIDDPRTSKDIPNEQVKAIKKKIREDVEEEIDRHFP